MDDAFGNWLAGFIDGEGCFTIAVNNHRRPCLRFDISVRMDDAEIIREIHKRLSIGKLLVRPARYASMAAGKPQIVWRVQRAHDCVSLAAILDAHPLRAKKKRDYAIWRIALDDLLAHQGRPGRNRKLKFDDADYVLRMEGYRDALQEIRKYDGEAIALPESPKRSQLRLVEGG